MLGELRLKINIEVKIQGVTMWTEQSSDKLL
jgi:hypothetical protein